MKLKALLFSCICVYASVACRSAGSKTLVVSGRGLVREATADEFKSVAQVQVKTWFGKVIGYGTGNWVATDQFLTAGHVVRNDSLVKPVRSITIVTPGLPDVDVDIKANFELPANYEAVMKDSKANPRNEQNQLNLSRLSADYALIPCECSVPPEYIAKISKTPVKSDDAISIVGYGSDKLSGPLDKPGAGGIKRVGTNKVWATLPPEQSHGIEFKGFFGALLGAGDSGSSIFNAKGEGYRKIEDLAAAPS